MIKGMKRWQLIVAALVALLALAGMARLILPHFYSEDATTSWTYQSPEYGFSITLPSSDWQEIKKRDCDVAFYNRRHSTLVGVNVTRDRDRDAIQNWIKTVKDYLQRTRDELLNEPQLSEGETDWGNPFAYHTGLAKSDQGGAVFVACSLVWDRKRRLTVRVMMEGPLTMRSKTGKSAEMDFYEGAAKTICFSVR